MNQAQQVYNQLTEIFSGCPDENVTSIYETARGSVYFVDAQGRTSRYKSYHKEHGIEDQGIKRLTDYTVYVSESDAAYFAGPLHGGFWLFFKELGEEDLELEFCVFDKQTQSIGKKFSTIPFQTKPEIGLCPVELFDVREIQQGIHMPSEIHPGNKIVSFHR